LKLTAVQCNRKIIPTRKDLDTRDWSLEFFAATEFSEIFTGRQLRQGVKFFMMFQ